MVLGEGRVGADPAAASALSRDRLVGAALALVQQEGLDALSMRALAERLNVKAASLYWHVHDRAELLNLLAEAVLNSTELPSHTGTWRTTALAVCAALETTLLRVRDSARLLLDAPETVRQSTLQSALAMVLIDGGLAPGDAMETATMMLAAVLVSAARRAPEPAPRPQAEPLEMVIDTGSRGVSVRAGPPGMRDVIRGVNDRSGFSPATIQGGRVTVRRLRGGRDAELELNPARPWRFHVQAPAWKTVLNLMGLDVRGVRVDSGAMQLECTLPPPLGSVPIQVSSGVVGVRLRRPPGVAVVAEINAGSVHLDLDGRMIPATTTDVFWTSRPDAAAADHYVLRISSGTVRVSLEEDPSLRAPETAVPVPTQPAGVVAALQVVLDGVAARTRSASS